MVKIVMKLDFFQALSIKTRVTLFTLIIFLLSLWSLAIYASRVLHTDMQRLLGDQQFSTASFAAEEVDHELTDRLRALEKVAHGIGPVVLGNATGLQTFLEQQLVLQDLFNAGIFVTGLDGTTIADVPRSTGRIGVNYMDRDFITAALRYGKSTVSQPIIGKTLKAPVFGMAVPIHDPQGNVSGALMGAIEMGKPNFLDMIKSSYYGKSGSYMLVERQNRMVVAASDNIQIMNMLPAPGVDPNIDRHVSGYEGTEVFVNPHGVEVLSSVKMVPLAGWYVAVSLPTEEAFAPIRDMQQRLLLTTLLLTLLAGALTWWMVRRELAPILDTVKSLAVMAQSEQHPPPLPITRSDEIGELIGGFNHLLEELGQRRDALRASEKRYRALVDWSPEAIIVHRDGKLIYVNPAAIEMLGAESEQDLVGLPALAWVHPDFRQIVLERSQGIDHVGVNKQMIEEKFLKLDGSVIDVEVQGTVIIYNGLLATQIAVRDITLRKQMEEQVRQLAFYDPLTELPNRRLLNDRLTQALAESKRSGRYGALLFLDLDNFKALNDSQGHAVGDLLLMQAAQRMKGCVREVDTVARMGGDEFVVMLDDLTADKTESTAQAGMIAEKIRSAVAAPYLLMVKRDGQADTVIEHQCSASIGVVVFIHHEGSQDDFFRWADTAMYQAKDAGSNLIRFYVSNV